MSDIKSLGQVAFEAFCAEVQGVAYDGSGIPPWDSLDGDRAKAQRGWEAAAQAVRQYTQMITALDRAVQSAASAGLTIQTRPSRWQPVGNPAPAAPIGEFIPAGHGEPPTGETVPVDVEPDDEVPDCDEPLCTRRAADH